MPCRIPRFSQPERPNPKRGGGLWAFVLVLILVTAGCGARREYDVSSVEVTRRGWDTLQVSATFAWRTAFVGSRPAASEDQVIHVFDASYDTLYVGPGPLAPVPDAALADRERLLVEVCGTIARQWICVQEAATASPKRVHVRTHITYPRDPEYEEGSYSVQFSVERLRFGMDEAWEPITPRTPPDAYLMAWVQGHADEPVRIPMRGTGGTFDLTRLDNYRDFKFFLHSRLMDEREAKVFFDVYAGLGRAPVRLASISKTVREKTQGERRDDVRYFARAATERLLDELGVVDEQSAVAYVEDWRYDNLSRRYVIEIEVHRRHQFRRGSDYVLRGTVEVGDNGTAATFRVQHARRARDGEVPATVSLGNLGQPVEAGAGGRGN